MTREGAARWRPRRPDGPAQWLVLGVFLVLIAFYAAAAVERYQHSHLYGDEPDYYFIGESLYEDGDLDLRNQYLTPDVAVFPGPLVFKVGPEGTPAPANFMPTTGALIIGPLDAIGGPLLVELAFAAMNLLSLWLLYLVIRRMVDRVPAIIAIGVVGLSVPLAWHAASVWTEIPALLCMSAILALAPLATRGRWLPAVGIGLLLGFLPFLHQKYAVLALGMAAALLLAAIRRWAWPVIAGLPVLGIAGTIVLSYALRGRLNFTQAGQTAAVEDAFDGSLNRFVGQPFAWFLDQTRGYIPLAPIWIVAIAGFIVLLRSSSGRRLLGTLVLGVGPFLVIYWFGPFLAGDSPPGRETLPVLPVLVIAMAAGIAALRGIVAPIIAALLAIPSIFVGVRTPLLLDQDLMYNNVGVPKLLQHLSRYRFDLTELWPRITTGPYWSYSRTLVMAALVLAIAAVLVLLSERPALRSGEPPLAFADPLAPA